jgi:hypothetical protein
VKAAAFKILLANACVTWAHVRIAEGAEERTACHGVQTQSRCTAGGSYIRKAVRRSSCTATRIYLWRALHVRVFDAANRTAIGDCVRYESPVSARSADPRKSPKSN